jgi:hypothetical protein
MRIRHMVGGSGGPARGGAAVAGHCLAVAIALGALVPWIGWLRLLPILAAVALEAIPLSRPARDWVHG